MLYSKQPIINPNPGSSSATIAFSLKQASQVLIELFSVKGKELLTIAGENFSEGNHHVNFNGDIFPAGIYFLRLKTEYGILSEKVVVE